MPGEYGFPRTAHLRTRAEYDRVYRQGAKVVGRSFVCYLAPQEAQEGSRLGLSVSRRVGRAHVRNRVKRCLREYFRTQRARFRTPTTVVVVARAGAAGLSCRECGEALDRLLARGGLVDA